MSEAHAEVGGPGDVFLRRQSAVHADGYLSSKLCGMAHLPRDGTGCEKDGARRSVRAGSLHAAEGEPDHQPTTRTRASIFAPEGFGSRNLLGTAGVGYGNSNIPSGVLYAHAKHLEPSDIAMHRRGFEKGGYRNGRMWKNRGCGGLPTQHSNE